jgi:hypothetical protein
MQLVKNPSLWGSSMAFAVRPVPTVAESAANSAAIFYSK